MRTISYSDHEVPLFIFNRYLDGVRMPVVLGKFSTVYENLPDVSTNNRDLSQHLEAMAFPLHSCQVP